MPFHLSRLGYDSCMTSPIISAQELSHLLASDRDVVLLDARPGTVDYAAGHLEGARHADLDTQLSAARDSSANPAHGGRHPLPPLDRWLRLLGEWGIDPATRVVVYDDQAGANAAARAWWMLRSVGHEAVSVLDGGFRAATEAGLKTTTAAPAVDTLPAYPSDSWQLPTVSVGQVDALRLDPTWRLLDVRSHPRFVGETEPIDPVAGHIPGAVNLPFADNLENGLFKLPDVLRRQYEQLLGAVSPEHLAVHCGSGVTACHTLLALEAAGIQGAALYVGSWSEWCRNDLPQAKG
jgi:thiosulfate/3-mercaptopyruvate sulfurtransferase